MKVHEIDTDGFKRYVLADKNGTVIMIVSQFMKYLGSLQKSINTQRSYCYGLKEFFEFLDATDKSYEEINLRDLADFVGWLHTPKVSKNTMFIKPVTQRLSPRSINLIIAAVVSFYDFMSRNGYISNNIRDSLFKQLHGIGAKNYKSFLHHVYKNATTPKNVLTVKVPKKRIYVLSKDEIIAVMNATSNVRDKLLILILYSTGMRIGEALSLFLEDFIFSHKNGHYLQLKDRGNLINGARLKTGERKIYLSQEVMDLRDDYLYDFLDSFQTDFFFVKVKGPNKGAPMVYDDVNSLFRRIRKKTGIDVHPHTLRHTHATLYYENTKDIKQVQERLGHSQIQTTMNLYVHPSDEELRNEWKKVEKSFSLEKPVEKGI